MNREKIRDYVYASAGSFVPRLRPACAHYVSRMLRDCGVDMQQIDYVPAFFEVGRKVPVPRPGDLIIFDRTYDAVAPAGIGPEDDMTHVGIVTDPGKKELYHFSWSQDRPVRITWDNLPRGWSINSFLDVIGDPKTPVENKELIELWVNERGAKMKKDGKLIPVDVYIKINERR